MALFSHGDTVETWEVANLGEILKAVKTLTQRSILVLTNGTTLSDSQVREDLCWADRVSIKLDGISSEQVQRVNRPVSPINIEAVLNRFQQFRGMFPGELGIQTLILSPWSSEQKEEYVRWVKAMA